MGPKQKTVTVTEALTRNLAPLLEMKVNQDASGIPTALEPGDILSSFTRWSSTTHSLRM